MYLHLRAYKPLKTCRQGHQDMPFRQFLVAKLLYFIFAGWSYQAVLPISFDAWPAALPQPAVGTWPEGRYWVGFTKCYGDVLERDMARTWKVSVGEMKVGHIPRHLVWHYPFGPRSFISLMIFIIIWCPSSKNSSQPTEWGPAKVLPIGARPC